MIKSWQPLIRYILALAGTALVYLAYVSVIVPRIESGANDFQARKLSGDGQATPIENAPLQNILGWLPANGWEQSPTKRLEVDEGIVLFEDYLQRENGIIEVFPFTLIVKPESPTPPGGSGVPPKNPMIVRASERAELKFETPFVMGVGKPGRLVQCQLEGTVNVYRQPTAQDQGFNFVTKNVQLTPQRIISLESVQFEIGQHSGIGRNLLIDLAHKPSVGAINTSFASIDGIKRLELAFIEKIRLVPEQKSSVGTVGTDMGDAPIDVTCNGALVIDFQENFAEFRDHVVAQRVQGPADRIEAELMQFYFARTELNPITSSSQQSLKIARVRLHGSPSKMNLPSHDALIKGVDLEYDLTRSMVIGSDPDGVIVSQGDQKFSSTKVQYQIRPDGSLGQLIAEGPGEILSTVVKSSEDAVANEPSNGSPIHPQPWHLTWTNYMTVADVNTRKLVTIDGQTSAVLANGTELKGDKMELWLQESTVVEGVNRRFDEPTPDSSRKTSREYQPIELLVDNHVVFHSPEIDGASQLLKVIWPSSTTLSTPTSTSLPVSSAPPISGSDLRIRTSRPRLETNLKPPLPLPWGNSVVPAIAPKALPPKAGIKANTRASGSRKISLTGDLITVFLADHAETSNDSVSFKKVVVEGNVHVLKPNEQTPEILDLKLTGSQLHLQPTGHNEFQAHLIGNSRLESPQLNLNGDEIHLDQRTNRIWVEGSGDLTIADAGNPKVNPAVPSQSIDVQWQAGMIFDGERIYFEHEVRSETIQSMASDIQSRIRSRSEGLSLQLNRRIDLSNLGGPSEGSNKSATNEKTKVVQITLVHQIAAAERAFPKHATHDTDSPVVLDRQNTDVAGNIVERQLIVVPNATMNVATGDVKANGPGRILGWQLNRDQSTTPQFALASSNPKTNRSASPIQYLHVNFDQRLIANSESQRVRVEGNTRTYYGGVDHWDQERDPDKTMPSQNGICITCDQIDLARWQPRGSDKPTLMVTAIGNANVRGELFEANAHRLAFDEGADMLTIEGDEHNDANLWSQSSPKAPKNSLSAAKIRYRPTDDWYKIDDVKRASLAPGATRK